MMKKIIFLNLMISGMLFSMEQDKPGIAVRAMSQITESAQLKQFGSIVCTEQQEQEIVNLIIREVLINSSSQNKKPLEVARALRNQGRAENADLYVEFYNQAIEKLQLLSIRK